MGLEVGCLVVYDANTRKPYLQVREVKKEGRERVEKVGAEEGKGVTFFVMHWNF